MSAEATAAMAPAPATTNTTTTTTNTTTPLYDNVGDNHQDNPEIEVAIDHGPGPEPELGPPKNDASSDSLKHIGLHSPPDSNSAMKLDGSDDSELSDVEDPTINDPDVNPSYPHPAAPEEEDEDIGDVVPDHWSGTVPVFKPDMHQFKDFKKFMTKVDSYGMKSGILKIIPPQEWKDQQTPLDDLVKQVRVREPIKQDIMGSNGTYRQVNFLHQRSYNLPQWRQLCDQSEHQPPARRGERRAQAPPKPKATASRRGRSTRGRNKRGGTRASTRDSTADQEERPMTPVSPKPTEQVADSVEQDPGGDVDDDDDDTPPVVGRMGGSRQSKPKMQSTSARRKYIRREGSAMVDEEAFREFDYRMDISDYTPERCEELERIYWKTLTYAPPLYGADLPGTLFGENTEAWNLNKLPNLLDVLGTKVPGVNTAYLYLGMWKATFAWHLEDVDLYSINYLHFGAPKQWYSISQSDARRFEAAMKSIWPTDAKACDQFLRHKAFLISPNHLLQYFNIKVNKCVSYPGEFVVTYPYGYHSGYNLGYNCAEAVNFALDSWLPMGKIAKRCECAQAQDSVWVDVYEIERKLRGEETDYEETEDEEEEEDEDDDLDTGVPTPRSSAAVRFKAPARKRKRGPTDKGEKKAKKVRLRVKNHVEPPCCLCPHDIPGAELLPTDDDRKAHRICALYGPETWIEAVDEMEVVANASDISKARLDLKCLYCRSKKGACFQCSHKKCARSYHATCAAAAGVLVEEAEVPIFGEDGTEYKEQAFEFSCRFHRSKRDRKLDSAALDECEKTRQAAAKLGKGETCQLQYHRGEIFAGIIIENRADEETFLVDIIPNGCEIYNNITNQRLLLTPFRDRVEVEWKWLLVPDPADFHLQKASPNAIPMPTSRKAKDHINATRRRTEELPRADEPFIDGGFTWAEFNHRDDCTNKAQVKVDLSKENQLWHYLGRNSTEARAQYTDDPKSRKHNPKSNFLDTVPRPAPPPAAQPRKSQGSTFPVQTPTAGVPKSAKPYQYKPKEPTTPSYIPSPFTAQQFVPKPSPYTAQQFAPRPSPYGSQQTVSQPSPYTSQPAASNPPTYALQQVVQTPQTPSTYAPPPSVPKPSPYASQQPVLNASPYTPQQTAPTPAPASAEQSTPKPTPVPRPTSHHSGHTRNRSSINSQNGHSLAFGSDTRFRTPPVSYGSGRFDGNAKSPFSMGFMQPPGLGPSPSPQNGQLFQAQARARSNSSASNRSFNQPMTSSAIRPSSSASAQAMAGPSQFANQQNMAKPARPSIVQKYAFFQVHHNRDSTKYRTPYAHWGGFTNGYEGNLRAHLMRSPDALFGMRRQSTGLSGVTTHGLSSIPRQPLSASTPANNYTSPAQHSATYGGSRSSMATPGPAYNSHSPYGTQPTPPSMSPSVLDSQSTWRRESANGTDSWESGQSFGAQLHPAIRAHYAAMLQKRNIEIEKQLRASQSRQSQPAPSSGAVMSSTPADVLPPAISTTGPTMSAKSAASVPNTPTTSATPVQNSPSSSSPAGTKVPFVPPKRSYVPPPRPWETLRKVQQPNAQQFATGPSLSPAPAAASFPTMTPSNQSPSVNSGAEFPRHLPSPGLQPSNVSGPFWPKFPQTVPNSNSLSQPNHNQTPYNSHSQQPASYESQPPYNQQTQLQYSHQNQLQYGHQHQLQYSHQNQLQYAQHSQPPYNHHQQPWYRNSSQPLHYSHSQHPYYPQQ